MDIDNLAAIINLGVCLLSAVLLLARSCRIRNLTTEHRATSQSRTIRKAIQLALIIAMIGQLLFYVIKKQ